MNELLKYPMIEWDNYRLNFTEKTQMMGILNITPDSFSDGGHFINSENAKKHALYMIENGADIIDIGGESTRPGYTMISEEEEIDRLRPVLKVLRKVINVPVSVDTYKAKVAEAILEVGANIINDIWGAKYDKNMAYVAAHYDVPIILMHNREKPDYKELMDDIVKDLEESIQICLRAGVKDERIILDPGIGFGKTYEQNVLVMRYLDKIVELGYPVLLGTSKKSIIAKTLKLPVDERMEGTGATVCYGITKGAHIMRVHDVKEMSRMAKMMDVMIGKQPIPLD